MGGPDGDEVVEVAELFGDLARELAGERSYVAVQQRIVDLAVKTLRGCKAAGISLVVKGKVQTSATTGDVPNRIDGIQNEVGEGPCLDAIREHEVFQTGDLPSESRWSTFPARAYDETGLRSVLSLRLYVEGDTLGALNLFSFDRDAFDDLDVALGCVFAAHAAVAMRAARREEQLEQKASSRDVIGRAKGILMARSDIDDVAAFDLLRSASQRLNQKLAQVAQQVVDDAGTHDLRS